MTYRDSIVTRLDAGWGLEPIGSHRIPLFGDAMESLCNRSRNLERRSPLACATLDRAVENVIGTGIAVRPKSDNPAFNAGIKKLWKRKIRGKRFDARRMLTWVGLQKAMYRGAIRDGDIGVLLVDEGYGPELQLIDRNSIATPPDRDDRTVRDGVELDDRGRPVAYWVRVYDSLGIATYRRVEQRDLILFHRSPRHDVVRGESAFNGTFRLFEQVEGLAEAVIVGARVSAASCVIRKRKRRGNAFKAGEPAPGHVETQAGEFVPAVDLEPGTILTVDSEDDLTAFQPANTAQTFEGTLRAFGRMLGLKFGLTVQRVLLDFSNTNYSVSRATVLQEKQFADPEQLEFVETILRRVYEWFVAKMVKAGLVVDDQGNVIPEPANAWEFEWIPPARPLVEPGKDAPGQKLMCEMNVESYRNVAEGNGYELDDIIADNKRDTAAMKAAGVLAADSAPVVLPTTDGDPPPPATTADPADPNAKP